MAFPQFEVMNTVTEMDIARTITSEANGIHLTVTDSATSGTSTGIRTSFTASGTRTAGTASCVASDLTITGATNYAYPFEAYTCQSGNPAIGFVAGYAVYMDNMGTGVSGLVGMDIGIAQSSTQTTATRFAFIRCRNHAAETPHAVLLLEGNPVADYLIKSDDQQDHGFVRAGGAGGSTLDFTNYMLIRIKLQGDVVYYVPCAKIITAN